MSFEIGKRYMFNAKKARKNKVGSLYGGETIVEYYNWKDGKLQKTGRLTPNATHVMWIEDEPFECDSVDGMGTVRRGMFMKVHLVRPFNGFERTEMIFAYPGPLTFITEAMPPEGQKAFEDKYFVTAITEVINDLW